MSYILNVTDNVVTEVAVIFKEILPLSAAIITTIPPILLGILLFPEVKKRDEEIALSTTSPPKVN